MATKQRHAYPSILLPAVLALLLSGAHSIAAASNIILEAQDEILRAGPREVVTASFAVENRGDSPLELTPRVELPEGWRLLSPPQPLALAPMDSTFALVHFMAPATAAAGSYRVEFSLSGETGSRAGPAVFLTVIVARLSGVEVKHVRSPEMAIAGEPYQAEFQVENNGNAPAAFRFEATARPGGEVSLSETRRLLAPGETMRLAAEAVAPAEADAAVDHTISVTAVSEDGELQGAALSSTKAIPRKVGDADLYHTVPARIAIRAAGRDRKEGSGKIRLQPMLTVKGHLDPKGRHKVDLLLQGPDIQEASAFGGKDRYHLLYFGDGVHVGIGDGHYRLDHLNEQGRYGHGASAYFDWKRVRIGGFSMRTEDETSDRHAVYAEYRIDSDNAFAARYLRSQVGDGRDNFGLGYRGGVAKWLNVDSEAAVGIDEDGRAGFAFYLDLFGAGERLSYNLRAIDADERFRGVYEDKSYRNLGLSYRFHPRWQVKGSLQSMTTTGGRDLEETRVTKNLNGDLGLEYRPASGRRWFWGMRGKRRRTIGPASSEGGDYEEALLRTSYGRSEKTYSLSASAEWGAREWKDDGNRDEIYGLFVFANFRPVLWQTWSLNANCRKAATDERPSYGYSLSSLLKLGARTSLQASYQYADSGTTTSRIYQAALACEFNRRQRLALRAKRNSLTKETAFVIDYSLDFEIPASRREDVGTLYGRVYDEDSGAGVENVVVRVGPHYAVTDSSGLYRFPVMTADRDFDAGLVFGETHYTSIPAIDMERPVRVPPGEEKRWDIPVITGAGIAGTMTIHQFEGLEKDEAVFVPGGDAIGGGANGENDQKGEIVAAGGMPGVTVHFRQGQAAFARVADRFGNFSAMGLRSGPCVATVEDDALGRTHRWVKSRIELELKPGEIERIEFKAVPRKLRLKMQQPMKVLRVE